MYDSNEFGCHKVGDQEPPAAAVRPVEQVSEVTPAERDRVRVQLLQRGLRELVAELASRREALARWEVVTVSELRPVDETLARVQRELLDAIDELAATDVALQMEMEFVPPLCRSDGGPR